MTRPRLVVIGGGLAGISAALSGADAGCQVTVVERRRRLGGLTWSFERNRRWFDNGQHVFMRCCVEYLSFLDRLGTAGSVTLQPRLDVPVLAPGGARASLRRSGLPAPLHLAGAIARYRHLSPLDRGRLVPAVLALRRLDPDDPDLDRTAFGDWLAAHGQSPRAVAALWNLIVLPTLNVPAERASLALAVKVFRTGLLDRADGADMGWSQVPLGQLHGEAGERALDAAGVEVVLGTAADGISPAGDGFVVSAGARTVGADAVVVATPPPVTAGLVPPSAGLPDLAPLGASPIVNVHLVLDRRVTDLAFAAAVDSPVQFVFDRTGSSGSGHGQCLAVSLSAADASIGAPKDELIRTFFEALGELFPAARRAGLVDAVVTRERSATFSAVAGSRRFRPPETTAIPGLFVAGAWCDTGWPATMEGAVRSGRAAARRAVDTLVAADPAARPPSSPRGGLMVNAPALEVTEAPTTDGSGHRSEVVGAVLSRTAALVGPAIDHEVEVLGAGLSAPVAHHLAGGGKRIRAALVLLSARAAGGTETDAMAGAVAIELVHNFSLLHDDLIDGDRQRRHRSTVWAEFGVGPAVVGGDALATLALQVLLAEPTPRRVAAAASLAKATLAMIAGQADDMAFETRPSVSVADCLAMEAGKTGALLECAMGLGAILVGAPAPVIAALQEFGACLGTAFQAVDDLLGIWGDPAVTGKPIGSDLLAGKKTLPVAIALAAPEGCPDELRELLDRRWSPAGLSDAELERAAWLVDAGGGRSGASETATRSLRQAQSALDRVPLDEGARAELVEVARFVTERTW